MSSSFLAAVAQRLEDASRQTDEYDETATVMLIDGDPTALAIALRQLAYLRRQKVEAISEGPEGVTYVFKSAKR